MNDMNYKNNRKGGSGSNADRSPSSTHPIRNAGGDLRRYSRSSDAYRSLRNAPEDSPRSSRSGRRGEHAGRRGSASSRNRRDESLLTPVEDVPRYSRAQRSEEGAETAERYSSRDQQSRYKSHSKRKRLVKRICLGVAGVLVVALVACGVSVFGFMGKVSANLNDGVDDMNGALVGTGFNQPYYVLLTGTDESEAREASGNFGGVYRTDSMMVARIDPAAKKVTMISIPRDTRVDLGDEYGVQKINAAHALGGDALAVKAASQVTGFPISHYVQINFDGFKAVVDALGGITVKVPVEIDDDKAGGHLDAGKQVLNGKQALILCRSRHAYDGVGSGDLYRAANQRLVLTAIAKKLLKSDIFTMSKSVEAISDYVDTDYSAMDLLTTMLAFQGFDTSSGMYTAQFPTESQYVDNLWYEVTNDSEWSTMKSRIEQGLSPVEGDVVDSATGTVMASSGGSSDDSDDSAATTSSYSGSVSVRNGAGVDGLASKAAACITALGFTVDTGNANDQFEKTQIIYADSSNAAAAKAIKDALGVGEVQLNDGSYLMNGDFMVVIGSDYGK